MQRFVGNRAALMLALASALAACSEPTGQSQDLLRPGVLQLAGWTGADPVPASAAEAGRVRWNTDPGPGEVWHPQVIVAPERVAAGQPFTVRTHTIGESGCWSAHSQEVTLAGRIVELTPFDVHSGHEICTMILVYLRHESTLTLGEPGEWTLRVRGRKARHGDETWETPVSAEVAVVVE
jgi:hypothetical protein